MLTLLLRFPTAVLLVVFIASGAVSGEVVMKAVGDKVSFHPDKPLPSPVSSIIWKHRKGGDVIKAIEWDVDDGFGIPNPRFQKITALDNRTGVITITGLKVEHSGVYTIDINSKEQEQRFTLTVKERVPKPEIKVEKTSDPNVVYLRCEYSETIIWKNSAGDILKGNPISPKGESLTVEKNGDPNNFYTCTLDNGASQETSDPVKEEDLFKDGSGSGIGAGEIVGIVFAVIVLIVGGICGVLYKFHDQFKTRVNGIFSRLRGDTGAKQNGLNSAESGGEQPSPASPNNENVPLKTEETNQEGKDVEKQ